MNYKKSKSNTNTADLISSKLQPQNLEAEESILSALLLDKDALLDVIELLEPEDFYKSSHQAIYRTITGLFAENEPVDLVTVANKLKDGGELESIGGPSYLARLVDTIPVTVNAAHHAKIIQDKSSLRKLISTSSEIVNMCYENQGSVDDVIDKAESSIFEIADMKSTSAFTSLDRLIDKNIDTLEERQHQDGSLTGISTGYSHVDKLTSGLQNSDLIILAARPSMGKTSFALNMARNVAINSNIPVAIFSLEMSKEQISMRLLTSEARVDSSRLKSGFISQDDWERVNNAADIMSTAKIFIDDTPSISSMEIRAKARRLKMEKDLGLIIVDYIQLMKSPSMGDRRDLEIGEISRSLKGLARELNVPIIALSQLNRMLEQRADKRPMMSDLRESGALEQDADIIKFIYRDEVYNKDENNPNKGRAELIIAKNRNGACGTAHMVFLGQYTRFEDLAREQYSDIE
jgi:replicative DNA helicase